MTITNQNVIIYRGDSAVLEIDLTMADGTPYDPESATIFKYRLSRNAHTPEADATISKEEGDGITIADNTASVELSPTDTDLPPGLYYHELKAIDEPDDVSTMMTGTVVIKRSLNMTTPTP
jgi:hypothetical protein